MLGALATCGGGTPWDCAGVPGGGDRGCSDRHHCCCCSCVTVCDREVLSVHSAELSGVVVSRYAGRPARWAAPLCVRHVSPPARPARSARHPAVPLTVPFLFQTEPDDHHGSVEHTRSLQDRIQVSDGGLSWIST